ncbi:MAG: hypothetical protein PHC92_07585 [Syntrophomonadaceae bacterium]|nr:hypothetical protein [Syntrophomonadaceae bacterium]
MVTRRLQRLFISIVIALLFCHLFVIQSQAVDIIDTFNKYKEVPDKVENLEKLVEDSNKEIQDLKNQIQELESQKQKLDEKYQDLSNENEELRKQLKESQNSYFPLFIAIIIAIVILIIGAKYIVRRIRNLGKR